MIKVVTVGRWFWDAWKKQSNCGGFAHALISFGPRTPHDAMCFSQIALGLTVAAASASNDFTE
jgi:hypothetical protein